jgi:hypothetical protein
VEELRSHDRWGPDQSLQHKLVEQDAEVRRRLPVQDGLPFHPVVNAPINTFIGIGRIPGAEQGARIVGSL